MPSRKIYLCILLTLTLSGCGFQGVNSIALPGVQGRSSDAQRFRIEIANVGTLEANSPVLLNDVVVGSIGRIVVRDWHAVVDVSVKPDVVVPANATASVGQTSLLGSMHLALDPPVGEAATGRLPAGSTIGLNRSSTYPSTEQTLSSLSTLVNGGGLGQIGDIFHNAASALGGQPGKVRDILVRLDSIAGILAQQRDDVTTSIAELTRLTGVLAGQKDTIDRALRDIPPALDVLIRQRPNITTALEKLRVFSDTATGFISDSQADLVRNLKNLEPTLKALADVGPELNAVLGYATVFPYGQGLLDKGLRGDFMNLFVILDFTNQRLRRSLLLGTRWEEPMAKLVPAPGDPWYLNYTYDPLGSSIAPPPPTNSQEGQPGSPPAGSPTAETGLPIDTAAGPPSVTMPAVDGPLLPVTPPQEWPPNGLKSPAPESHIFAGPYGARAPEATPEPTTPPAGQGG